LLAAWAFVLLAPPGPASAGGPTSALLSVPGEGRTASLYYTDDAYEELSELLGVTGVSGAEDTSGLGHEIGIGVTVTWLIHDVTPWRVDRIYLEGVGAPWVATQVMDSETGSIWDSPVTWHQPEAGKELALLLDRLGVGQAQGAGVTNEPVPPAEPELAVPTADEPASAAPADDSSGTSVRDRAWWGLGGLAAGVLLAVGWTRARSARAQARADGWGPEGEHPQADSTTEWLSVGR
jgi:hypothetical protein